MANGVPPLSIERYPSDPDELRMESVPSDPDEMKIERLPSGPSSESRLPAFGSLAVAEKVKRVVVGLRLIDGTFVPLVSSPEIKALHERLSQKEGKSVIDLQNAKNTDDEDVQRARRLVEKALQNSSFEWSYRPEGVRGDMHGKVPYEMGPAKALSNLSKRKESLSEEQEKAREIIRNAKERLNRQRQALDEQFRRDPRQTHLKHEIETIAAMITRLEKINMAAIDFEMAHPFPSPILPDQLHATIEKRRDLALQWIGKHRDWYPSLKSKIWGNPDKEIELSFAQDLALQGIPDRDTYDQACQLLKLKPKQDTLELPIIRAAQQNHSLRTILESDTLSPLFNKLSEATQNTILSV